MPFHPALPLMAAAAWLASALNPVHAADPPAAPAKAASAPNEVQLEAVVVTGDKLRRTELANTQSIATRNARQIQESSADTLEDVIRNMANVGVSTGLSIRGIQINGAGGGGGGRTATVTTDGVSQIGRSQDITSLSVWDTEGVEVLRGPQSTNQGRNALAGAVVLRTRNPTADWDLRGRVAAFDPDGRNIAIAGGGPIAQDVLAFRLSAEDHMNAGATFNQTLNDKRWNHDDRRNVRGKLLLTPQGSDYQALLTLVQQTNEVGDEFVEATRRSSYDRISLANLPDESRTRNRASALEQTLRFGGIDWTLLSTLSRDRWDRVVDFDESELNQGNTVSSQDDRGLANELRGNLDLAFGSSRLRGVFGAYVSRQRADERRNFTLPLAFVLTTLRFPQCPNQAQCEQLFPTDRILQVENTDSEVRNRALFAEFDYEISKLTFTAGWRYDRETQDRIINTNASGNTAISRQIVTQLLAGGFAAPNGTQMLSTEYSALLPKLGVSLRLSDDWRTGFTAQRGYRVGGVEYSYQRGAKPFDPEYTNNYDLSLKGMLRENLQLAMNAYLIDWRDQQVNVGANTLDNFIVNAGRSRLYGLETELRGKVLRELELFGALGLSHARYIDFKTANNDFSGNRLIFSPSHTWSLGGTWKPGAWIIGGDITREGSVFSDPGNTESRRNPAHTLVNGKASFALAPRARFFASVRNLFDKTYTKFRLDNAPGRQVVTLGAPRTLMFGFEAEL